VLLGLGDIEREGASANATAPAKITKADRFLLRWLNSSQWRVYALLCAKVKPFRIIPALTAGMTEETRSRDLSGRCPLVETLFEHESRWACSTSVASMA
jgi:hypothetical protein